MLSVALDDIKKNGGTSLKKYYISISLLMTIIVLVFDQVSKWLITISMKVGDSYEIILTFKYYIHRNNSAAWGILSGKCYFFYIITIIILIVLVIFYIKEAQFNLFMQVAISLLFAGALGNFIDRVLHGEVVDFIDTNIFGYDFPIFNIADSSLTIGVIFVIIALIKDAIINKKEV